MTSPSHIPCAAAAPVRPDHLAGSPGQPIPSDDPGEIYELRYRQLFYQFIMSVATLFRSCKLGIRMLASQTCSITGTAICNYSIGNGMMVWNWERKWYGTGRESGMELGQKEFGDGIELSPCVPPSVA